MKRSRREYPQDNPAAFLLGTTASTLFSPSSSFIPRSEIWSHARRHKNGGGSVPEYAEQTTSKPRGAAGGQISLSRS